MVRIGTFPLRLLAVRYGADIVYNQELIDHKVVRFTRKWNPKLSSIDFVDSTSSKLVFRTFPDEPVVFQIGSNNAVRCLKAATLVSNDVLGIDLNMGCPKKFSVHSGMGAALLHQPETVEDIIKTLKRNLRSNLSITAKIRLLEDEKKSMELCRRLERMEINALGIHARYRPDRSRKTVARIALVKPIAESLNIPCIYNGDIYKYEDIAVARKQSGCTAVMIARGAQWNVSVFDRKNQLDPLDKVIAKYIDVSEQFENKFANSKYAMTKMVCGERWLAKSDVSTAFFQSKKWKDCRAANQKLAEALKKRGEKQADGNGKQDKYVDPSVFTVL